MDFEGIDPKSINVCSVAINAYKEWGPHDKCLIEPRRTFSKDKERELAEAINFKAPGIYSRPKGSSFKLSFWCVDSMMEKVQELFKQ